LLFGIQNDREWLTFCERVLGDAGVAHDPRFATNPRRVANRPALDAAIHDVFEQLTADQVEAKLLAAGIAFGRVRDAVEAAAHPQTAARGRWQQVETPAGPISGLAPVWTLDGATLPMGRVPALGEDTAAILAELGL